MATPDTDLVALEKKFWQSMVDDDTDAALQLLAEPALMVSSHGAMKFDHAQYRQMAEQGSMVIKSFELDDVQVHCPTDGTALLTYRVKQTMATRGKSDDQVAEMADSSVWQRSGDGQWRCVMHTETPLDTTKR
ncbi:MAG: nuclear transport factor 2 family protein [Comamonadaceae bacterium]|nr:MAG: nuclear transport factor 2 family protein [Comamonadaceae bacterium]